MILQGVVTLKNHESSFFVNLFCHAVEPYLNVLLSNALVMFSVSVSARHRRQDTPLQPLRRHRC